MSTRSPGRGGEARGGGRSCVSWTLSVFLATHLEVSTTSVSPSGDPSCTSKSVGSKARWPKLKS